MLVFLSWRLRLLFWLSVSIIGPSLWRRLWSAVTLAPRYVYLETFLVDGFDYKVLSCVLVLWSINGQMMILLILRGLSLLECHQGRWLRLLESTLDAKLFATTCYMLSKLELRLRRSWTRLITDAEGTIGLLSRGTGQDVVLVMQAWEGLRLIHWGLERQLRVF
jgi:hypothetical protein